MARILVVDDEQDLVWALRHVLSGRGYEVLTAYDGMDALAVARRHHPDLVILDIGMPQLDGLKVCRALRRDPALAAVPILFLTAHSAVEDRVTGLQAGGDDYMTKPFDTQELAARVMALLRRARPTPEERPGPKKQDFLLRVAALELDLRTCQVRLAHGRPNQLTPTEFDLLYYLITHQGEVFSSQHLLRHVWHYPPETGDASLVRWHIKNLRVKIEPDPTQPNYIQTVPRHGYTFCAEREVREP